MASRLHERSVDQLGSRIVDGSLPAGYVMLAEQLEGELGVSRSVVREAVRVLQSLGLVETIKRVGIKVQPETAWNPYDPLVIRWRLRGAASRGAQLRSLTELRAAVEPVAAELAARHAPADVGQQLHDLADQMRWHGRTGDLRRFVQADIRFHALVLAGSGNEMFAKLHDAIGEVITERIELGQSGAHPHAEAVQLHLDVAEAVSIRRPAEAAEAMRQMMELTVHNMCAEWEHAPRIFSAE